MLLVRLAGADGAQGLFQALAAGLLVASALVAWTAARPTRRAVAADATGLASIVLVGLLVGAQGAVGLGVLVAGVALLAAGVAALARGVRVPWAAAGGVGLLAVVAASTGLLWADALAERVSPETRGLTRLEVVDHDPLLALAYGTAGHDRLHEREIYGRVPLASSTVKLSTPMATGLRLARIGGAALVLAVMVLFFRRRRA